MSNPQLSAGLLRDLCVCSTQCVASEEGSVTWQELAAGRRLLPLYGRCVMLRTRSQLASARALVELDGFAARIVLCPAELTDAQCLSVARAAKVEVVVVDQAWDQTQDQTQDQTGHQTQDQTQDQTGHQAQDQTQDQTGHQTRDQTQDQTRHQARGPAHAPGPSSEQDLQPLEYVMLEDQLPSAGKVDRKREKQAERRPLATEWILLTSGTTHAPKLVVHSFESLTWGMQAADDRAAEVVWSTFYDVRRYGGLQIFLRAALTGSRLLLSSRQQSLGAYLARASEHGVTHISGTPSHWRRALMSSHAGSIHPRYVRLSGEIADQAILDQLRHQYPQAAIVHAFASTEAGVAFEVSDGLAGVPAHQLGQSGELETRVAAGTLQVRSPRNARCYLGHAGRSLKEHDGFVDTRDIFTLEGERYFFGGRQDGTINVGGLKVHPEEVESVLNRHPAIRLSLVGSRPSPLVGALVVADVVLIGPEPNSPEAAALCREVISFCRQRLPAYKVPALLRPVASLPLAATGKLKRPHA